MVDIGYGRGRVGSELPPIGLEMVCSRCLSQ